MFEAEFGKLQTDEVVLTEERETHIKERHPQDHILFDKYCHDILTAPDIVLCDGKNDGTVIMVRKMPDTNLSIVLRLALETDSKSLKNLIITFHRLRERHLKKLAGRNKILYMRE